MLKKIWLLMIVCVMLLPSCSSKSFELGNRTVYILGELFVEVYYPKDWTVNYIDGNTIKNGSIKISNNKPVYTGDRIDFRIGNNIDNIKDIEDNAYGYEQFKSGNIEFKFCKPEFVWVEDKFISAKIGIIKIDEVTCFDIKFEYLPDDEITPEVKAILMSKVFDKNKPGSNSQA